MPLKNYKVHWKSGVKELIKGLDIGDACKRAGIDIGTFFSSIERIEDAELKVTEKSPVSQTLM